MTFTSLCLSYKDNFKGSRFKGREQMTFEGESMSYFKKYMWDRIYIGVDAFDSTICHINIFFNAFSFFPYITYLCLTKDYKMFLSSVFFQ